MRLIRKADLVYSRDNLSAKVIKEQSGVEIKVGSDMAFKLPYDRTKYKIDNGRINIGINVSSCYGIASGLKKIILVLQLIINNII